MARLMTCDEQLAYFGEMPGELSSLTRVHDHGIRLIRHRHPGHLLHILGMGLCVASSPNVKSWGMAPVF